MRRPWTEDEIKLAREMRAAGHFYEEIDWALRWSADMTKGSMNARRRVGWTRRSYSRAQPARFDAAPIAWVHIPFEEAKMRGQFGVLYDNFVAKVRRWI